MKLAATQMLGERDYSAFRAADCQGATAIRRVDRVQVRNYGNAGIEFEVEGSAFLKNMVRIMAGTLVDVGRGNIPADSIQDVVDSKDRGRAGTTAPARGLTLVEIFYPKHPWQRPVGIGMPGRY